MKSTRMLLAGAAMALAAGTGAVAVAQTQAPPAGHEHRMGEGRRGEGRREGRDPTERLRAILQLRPNQEAALTAYVGALKPDRAGFERMRDQGRPKTTPERLARMEQAMAARNAAMKVRIDATRRFYDQLDPSQKKAFDALGPMGGPGGRHATKIRHDGGPMHGPHGPMDKPRT